MIHTESLFTQIGGVFCTPINILANKLSDIKAFVFDWDGVFNNASKNESKSSTFNEVDSMGTNMLRFSYFLKNNSLPYAAVISGEKNEMAFYFTEREHFDACYFKVPHKTIALDHFCAHHQIKPSQVCYVFDDVLDLSIAGVAGLRIAINRKANPLFKNYLVQHNLVDYITAHESGNFAVRETTEMLMGIYGNFDQCMDERKDFSAIYQGYLAKRQALETRYFTVLNQQIIEGK
jgi:3-deoxy-D-manno-octulosonate 8-phosphate phosphatase (KDO 8-P phosphatase)